MIVILSEKEYNEIPDYLSASNFIEAQDYEEIDLTDGKYYISYDE